MLLFLRSFLFSCLCFTPLFADTDSIECKAGLMPFTLYAKGAIRTYYNPDSTIQGIGYFDENGIKYATQEWSYDTAQQPISRILSEKLSWFCSHTSTFNYMYKAYQLAEIRQTYGKGGGRKICYSYTDTGSLSKETCYDFYFYFLDLLDELVEYHYDLEGRLSSKSFLNPEGELLLCQEWKYDELGRVIEFATYDRSHNLIWATQYSYTELYAIETYLGPNHQLLGYIHTYTHQAESLEEAPSRIYAFDSSGQLINLTTFSYNLLGELTKVIEFDSSYNLLGFIHFFYDEFARPYQIEYEYQDMDLLSKRVHPYLMLPQNNL